MGIIGKMTHSRGTWGAIKPVTKVEKCEKLYNRKRDKQVLRKEVKHEHKG